MANSSESKLVAEGASWGSWIAQKCADGLSWIEQKCRTEGSYDNIKATFSKVQDWVTWAVDGVKSLVSKFVPSSEAKVEAVPVKAETASAPTPDMAKAIAESKETKPASAVVGGVDAKTADSGVVPSAKDEKAVSR